MSVIFIPHQETSHCNRMRQLQKTTGYQNADLWSPVPMDTPKLKALQMMQKRK